LGKENRNTIFVDEGAVLSIQGFPDRQFIMRLSAPKVAANAIPGAFVHVQCNPEIPMRRPISIMRVNPAEGWIEIYFKVIGAGLEALSKTECGQNINLLGPIGNGFSPSPDKKYQLMIGGGVGIPPMLYLAEALHAGDYPGIKEAQPVVFMGSESPFPFELQASSIPLQNQPDDATACVPDMERIGVPSRLASLQDYPGVHKGYVTDLAASWLKSNPELAASTEIFACGPEPMLHAVAKVADEFSVPAQLCLEEFMACAVGGCAGCAIEVQTPEGPAMKRVCVDGPVFAAESIYPG